MKSLNNQNCIKILLGLAIFFTLTSCTTKSIKEPRPENWANKINNKYFNNLHIVSDSIYRSEKPSISGFKYFEENKMASVLDLRRKHKDSITAIKANYTGKLYFIPTKTADLSDKEIIEALKVLQNSPKPIVIHCAHGSDRTGTVIAMYRIVFQNWTKKQAIEEMKRGGYNYHWFYPELIRYIEDSNIEEIKKQLNI